MTHEELALAGALKLQSDLRAMQRHCRWHMWASRAMLVLNTVVAAWAWSQVDAEPEAVIAFALFVGGVLNGWCALRTLREMPKQKFMDRLYSDTLAVIPELIEGIKAKMPTGEQSNAG